MAREVVCISLSPELRRFVDLDLKSQGFTSVSEYFRELIRDRRQKRVNERRLQRSMVEFKQKKAQLELDGYRPPDSRCMCSMRDKNGRFTRKRLY